MILTCPSCATSYFTPDEAIGPNGRRVRCQSCAHVWTAMLDEPLELTAPTPVAAPVAATEPAATGFGKREDGPETLAETPAPELPKAFRAKQEQQRRLRRAATHGAVWAGLASVFVGLIAAAWLFRVEMVEMWPRSAAAYAAVGMPVNPTGLEFEAVTARTSPNSPDQVLVSGALRNVREREVVSPTVRLALLDAQGGEIANRMVRIDAAPVLPGGVQGFAAILPDPGGRAAGVGVDFAPEVVLPEPEPVEAQNVAVDAPSPARVVRRPPPPEPDTGPLRSALAPMEATSPHARPIEAVPVVESPLDSAHAEAVSAAHG